MRSTFRARVEGFREPEGRDEGIAEVMVAVFDIPDTNVAVGNSVRQVIDPGAFRSWIEGSNFESDPVPLYLDHGDAMITGFTTAAKKLGFAKQFRETADGLVMEAHYNLGTQRGREAWSDLKFDPNGTQFSFRWPPDEEIVHGDDGYEHVRSFSGVIEASQVGFGAQRETGVLATTMRSGKEEALLRPHSTDLVTTGRYSVASSIEKLDPAPASLRSMFAWAEADADRLEQFRYPHHVVDDSGVPGAAHLAAVRAGLEDLKSATDMADEDRHGAWAHFAQHLEDAGETAELLRGADGRELGGARHQKRSLPDPELVTEWMNDPAFRETVEKAMEPAVTPGTSRIHDAYGEWNTVQTFTLPTGSTWTMDGPVQWDALMQTGRTTTTTNITFRMTSDPVVPVSSAISLDRMAATIRNTWRAAHPSLPVYVDEVFVTEPDAGHIVIRSAKGWGKVEWARTDGKVVFAEEVEPLEQNEGLLRSFLEDGSLLPVLEIEGEEVATKVRFLADEAAAEDPVQAFHRQVLGFYAGAKTADE